MKNTERLDKAVHFAEQMSLTSRLEFVTPEMLLVGICCTTEEFTELCESYFVDYQKDIKEPIYATMSEGMVPEEVGDYELLPSFQLCKLLEMAEGMAKNAGRDEIDVPHVLHAMLSLEESYANYLLRTNFTDDEAEFLSCIIAAYEDRPLPEHYPVGSSRSRTKKGKTDKESDSVEDIDDDEDYDDEDDEDFDNPFLPRSASRNRKWKRFVTCVNDKVKAHNPLIGREAELEHTIQVLCRCDKNNPLHVGEPGVGKTALIYGLAKRIEEGKVPDRLKKTRIYMMDMGGLVAGTQYRGEFEDRVQNIMKGATKEKNVIIYIDEIHTLIGAGSSSESSLDASNMLKPYLEAGKIRFIGSTTYKEYNKYFLKAQGIVRRFQKIDISEPSDEETVNILEGLRARYEDFHGVKYDKGLMEYAVAMSRRYITDRFLPDKAIDLLDEAGAYREMHPLMKKVKGKEQKQKVQRVGKELINDTLKRICHLSDETLAVSTDGNERLHTLADRMQSEIFGQDEAVRLSTEAVMMGKAGLLDGEKPIASLLFVGPTGVGKTEVCRVLARQLGVELVRFDMSEYTEKHTVAKLIGSPAGYVGYEDGGLLTDAIRKNPNCVLLLDEIEKAHSDIYNILLQVMDYGRLTDNRGNKSDFRNVILIMTSNAGAQYASQASVGFSNLTTRGDAMLQTVKKTFKPEFLNRLSGTVVFNDMDLPMARRILDKKLKQLCNRLASKNVTLTLQTEAYEYLLHKGFTPKYGVREMDRVLQQQLNPLLMRAILFGELQNGGEAIVTLTEEKLTLQ